MVFVTEKFGWNRYNSFDNMQVRHEMTPNENRLTVTPKGTSLCGNTSYDGLIVKIGLPVRARREPKWNQFLLVVKSHRAKSQIQLR